MKRADTRSSILDTAEALVQRRGYNAFSFRDLAERVRIKSASIHYHFPSKADLGRELMARYRERFLARLREIESSESSARARLEGFIDLFRATLRNGDRLCLCGMLATEYATLPRPVQSEVRRFFEESERWLARIILEGQSARELSFRGTPETMARTFLSTLEGAMIAARTFGDESRLAAAGRCLLETLGAI